MVSYHLDVIDVSATFFYCAKHYPSCTPITHKKLQKLMYYAQGFSMARTGKKIFDDNFEIIGNGAICKRLYDEYKGVSYFSIPDKMVRGNCENIISNGDVFNIIREVWEAFANLSGKQLELMAHRELPYTNAVENNRNAVSDKDMVEFFTQVLLEPR